MRTIVSIFLSLLRLLSRPSTFGGGMLWSLGLHTTVFAATYAWLASPTAHVLFSGNRYAVHMQASNPKLSTSPEIEDLLEFELLSPIESLPPIELLQEPHQPVVVLQDLQLPENSHQVEEHEAAFESEVLQRAISFPEPVVIEERKEKVPINPPVKPSIQPSQAESVAAIEQFAGVEDKEPADLTANRPPSYPIEALRQRLEGIVLLRIFISTSGEIERVEIAKSSGHLILDQTAVTAVRTWQARPAKQAGKFVATVEILPIHFRL